MKTFINFADCPFRVGDEVECVDSGAKARVQSIEDEHVFCITAAGSEFYRTWSHNRGGLKLISRAPPAQEEA